ncbi:PIN domain-containing protein [Desulfoscipio gibsoniae]
MARTYKLAYDANALISLAIGGKPHVILSKIIYYDLPIRIGVPEYAFQEAYDVLEEKAGPPKARKAINYLKEMLKLVDAECLPLDDAKTLGKFESAIDDFKDVPVVASAVRWGADYIITGDSDFYSDKTKKIISPIMAHEFLDLLEKENLLIDIEISLKREP